MGHNVDFVSLLGLPRDVVCKNCHNKTPSYFDDYDIDCGNPGAEKNKGYLILDVYCETCEKENEYKFKIKEVTDADSELTKL